MTIPATAKGYIDRVDTESDRVVGEAAAYRARVQHQEFYP